MALFTGSAPLRMNHMLNQFFTLYVKKKKSRTGNSNMRGKRQQEQRKREEVEGRSGQRWFCFCSRCVG